jgi:uncharacterized protein Smg (DUF494 family)
LLRRGAGGIAMMNERIKEIIDYIMDLDPGELRESAIVQEELEGLGYNRFEIRQAFRMLDVGAAASDQFPDPAARSASRVLGEFEKHGLSVAAQGYLINLRRLGVVSEMQLSMMIDYAAFEFAPPVSLDEVKELAGRYIADLPDDVTPDTARRDEPLH